MGMSFAVVLVINDRLDGRRRAMKKTRCLTLILGTVLIFWPFAQGKASINEDAGQQEEVHRHCIGLLWCTERSANGTSIDGLLWLYSSEERGSYSRLAVRPLIVSC
jgi:hypothetical protein